MQALSRDLGIADRVAFKGRVDQSELPWFYSAVDLLALPSSYESFGMVALEALACGTPVAATRVGAMENLLGDRRNGAWRKTCARLAGRCDGRPAQSPCSWPAGSRNHPARGAALRLVPGGGRRINHLP